MYTRHNEGISVVAEIVIIALKNKNYNYLNSLSKNTYIDKYIDEYDIVNKYNNHRTIKIKSVDMKPSI